MSKKSIVILSFTWGLPLTIIGIVVAIALVCVGHIFPKRHGACLYFEVGKEWGGVNLGIVFLTSKKPTEYTKNHEYGHAIQNCMYGVAMLFIVCIPSAVRYWYRELAFNRKGLIPPTEYDDIWFEKQATELGEKAAK